MSTSCELLANRVLLVPVAKSPRTPASDSEPPGRSGPAQRAVQSAADRARPIQSGDVNLYLLYVFLVVIIAYLIYPF